MLPLLLLPLFISSSLSMPCEHMHEFLTNVKDLGESVKNCSENCSLVHITDRACTCLNASQEECASPDYAIKALQSLHLSDSSQTAIRHLIKALKRLSPECREKMNFCSLPVKLSPKSLHKKLEKLAREIQSEQ